MSLLQLHTIRKISTLQGWCIILSTNLILTWVDNWEHTWPQTLRNCMHSENPPRLNSKKFSLANKEWDQGLLSLTALCPKSKRSPQQRPSHLALSHLLLKPLWRSKGTKQCQLGNLQRAWFRLHRERKETHPWKNHSWTTSTKETVWMLKMISILKTPVLKLWTEAPPYSAKRRPRWTKWSLRNWGI